MGKPFPTDKAGRAAVFQAMQAAAPELMQDIAALRAQFPDSKLTHFKADGIEYGEGNKDGWVVDENAVRLARWRRAKAKAAADKAAGVKKPATRKRK